ncbi:uncharacterized protein LOC115453331 [Manduca sexta]|uniref:uncharacterized protein LOC115453331 n=1 Tax=Manduca sexta TaxID=7130 RepID=UPI00188E79FC|nr:uncharacterized protein LOC115453331 [Manduca sexta]
MSLDNSEQEELCYFISPNGEDSSIVESIAGVTVHERSIFVSCRMTVGPIERSLIGNWTLCARRTDTVIHERCQHINVTFSNNNNPSAAWHVNERPQFNHSVSLGRYLTPVVIGDGNTRSCHIITPDGEDLIITHDTNYRNLELVSLNPSTRTCSVRIGPIESWMMGEWTLYGMFRRKANNEVRLPMRLLFYDEENPYTQPYNITNLDSINRNVPLGRTITLEVTGTGNTDECEYRPPTGQRYLFNATDHFPGVTIMDVGVLTICRITVGPVDADMFGSWELVGRFSNNEIFTERRQPFYIAMGDQDEQEDTEWLPNIELVARTGQLIDITLNNMKQDERCFFDNPRGERGSEETGMSGVRIHESSRYVSCRITIGPMEQSLIGNWTLCGNYGPGNSYERCQAVNIAWHNSNNPSSNWQVNNQRLFNHSVSLNKFLNPVVESSGSTISCHIITPNGEDLVLTPDSQYPRLQVAIRGASCAFTIGPLERWMLGDWTIYGMFRGRGIFENRLPMNLALFDENNPYTQPYNITELNRITRLIPLGVTTTVEVTGGGNIDRCMYRVPTGQVYEFNAETHFPGVTIPAVGNSIVCRLSIGPIDRNMLGEWQVVGQFRTNNGTFTERRQAFSIIEEDPENPFIEKNREIINLNDRTFDTQIGENVSVSIGAQRFISRESCHIRTPAGRQYIMAEHFNLPGVTPFTNQNVECGVRVTVLSEDMIGEWVLISRGNSVDNPIERRQRFIIHAEVPVAAFSSNLEIVQGNNLYVRLRDPTDEYETCRLTGPQGNEVAKAVNNTLYLETCGFIVKEISLNDNGIWHIVFGRRIVYIASINVTVIERDITEMGAVDIIKDVAVNRTVGPEDATYCRLEDPTGAVVFDGFGRCRLTLERVTTEHDGTWDMIIGLPGSVLVKSRNFVVNVMEAG